MHRSVLILTLAILASIAVACGGSSASTPTPIPTATSDVPFDEADLRAMLTNEEIEAAIPFVVGTMEIQDFEAMAAGSDPQVLGIETFLGLVYSPADGTGGFTLIVIDFESQEFVRQHIALAKTDQDPVSNVPTIGDETLAIQGPSGPPQSGVAVVMFWKGNRAVLLNAIGLPQTREVLDGVIALAEIAESRVN